MHHRTSSWRSVSGTAAQTCYKSRPHAFSEVDDYLQLVKPGAAAVLAATAAAPFYNLRGSSVARLVVAYVGYSVPPVRESAAGYEPAAGPEPFCPLPPLDDFLNTRLLAIPNYFPRTIRQPPFSRGLSYLAGVLGDVAPRGTQGCVGEGLGGSKPLLSSTPLSLGRSNVAPLGRCAILLLSPVPIC